MLTWQAWHPNVTIETLGYIPDFVSDEDPRPAREQFAANYISGWHPVPGFKILGNGNLVSRGDPPCRLLAQARLRDEYICLYEHSWVSVIDIRDGTYEVSRMD